MNNFSFIKIKLSAIWINFRFQILLLYLFYDIFGHNVVTTKTMWNMHSNVNLPQTKYWFVSKYSNVLPIGLYKQTKVWHVEI